MEQVFGGFTVDPLEAVRYDRNDVDLQVFWLFAGCVAGKTAKTISAALDRFLVSLPGHSPLPFRRVYRAVVEGTLERRLRDARLGQYRKLTRFMTESLALDLRTATVEDLEAIHGVGPKTARFFLMFTRENARYAALDTHILKFLRASGIEAPRSTPSPGRRYRELELEFLKLVPNHLTPAEFDLAIWTYYSGNGSQPVPLKGNSNEAF